MNAGHRPAVDARATRLRALLDVSGVSYTLDPSGDVEAGARFRLHVSRRALAEYDVDLEPTIDAVPVRAHLLGPAVRFSAPVVQPESMTSANTDWLDWINDAWHAGWASSDHGTASIHVSIYAGDGVPTNATVVQALAALRDIAAYLTASITERQSVEADELREVLAAADGVFGEVRDGDSLDDVDRALRQLGIVGARTMDERREARLIESDGHTFSVEFSKEESRFLRLIARHPADASVPPTTATRASMRRLNGRLHLGAILWAPEGVRYRAALPLAWLGAIETELVSWLVDHAASALAVVRTLDERTG